MNRKTVMLKGGAWETFSKKVSALVLGVDFVDVEFGGRKRPEPVPFNQEVLRAVRYTLVSGKTKSSLIVFERSGLDSSAEIIINVETFHNVDKKTLKWKERLKSVGEGRIFGFKCGE